ncbi:uncharacterized protein L969DRAFT_49920 [Mixia osmundae IAM 14324]|uniref:Cytochrome b-c1 complex subunit 2, mitochondrial n=1 Tax=Mixia osmundae (strain CBS 9802 / IAM 14324 / JCM 22182 / KY 12970) TaxID=764103 RepID=G7E169_MIXOS|nr:uncharacterized protein L969DRAFT_49920 [Mixia osmundae IAM 14324]KEI38782.1 hypothetical protein L969DRAFT_49920 [Mixia osmundae IAM 14324]GAA96579.1 hypothetical protein E5Q_03249 [Mixia osmundae IAM 14324]
MQRSSVLAQRSSLSGLAGAARGRAWATSRRPLATSAGKDDISLSTVEGYKVARLGDTGVAPSTGSITVAIKAGSRYESEPGIAHVFKNMVFKNTTKRSALRIVRETELYGGVLTASLNRDSLFLTAEFLKGDEAYFTELLGDVITASTFQAFEYIENVVPQIAAEYAQAVADPLVFGFDNLHQLAFRKGLGNSLFASPNTPVDHIDAVAYARKHLSNPAEIAIVAAGVDGSFEQLVSESFAPTSAAPPSASSDIKSAGGSAYFGGESRVPQTHSEQDLLLVGFQGGSLSSPEWQVLQHLLGGDSALKWTNGITPLASASSVLAASTPTLGHGAGVKAFNLQYSDNGLFGFAVSAPTDQVRGLAQKAIDALKDASKSVKAEDLKRAVAKAKFHAALALESRISRLEIVASQIQANGSASSLEQTFAALDKVTASQVQKAATAALKSKPSAVAYGNTHELPFVDELSL